MEDLVLTRLMYLLLGKRTTWRLGRALYMLARGDVANDITTNGELMVQRSVVAGWRQATGDKRKLVVFDVGANKGDWSEPMLNHMTASHERALLDLHMFEPVPSTLAVLRERLLNAGKGVTLQYHQLALSSDEGTEQMYLLGASGINSLHPDTATGKASSISISKDTASHFCTVNEIEEIHLMKCDTEGHDMEVIQGALPLLQQGRIKVLQFEYNHCWIYSRHYLKDAFDVVAGLPYRLGKIQSDHVELYSDWHPELERFFEANYLLIHHDAMPWFCIRETVFDEYNTSAAAIP
jgi:FkbM family methyltransferase